MALSLQSSPCSRSLVAFSMSGVFISMKLCSLTCYWSSWISHFSSYASFALKLSSHFSALFSICWSIGISSSKGKFCIVVMTWAKSDWESWSFSYKFSVIWSWVWLHSSILSLSCWNSLCYSKPNCSPTFKCSKAVSNFSFLALGSFKSAFVLIFHLSFFKVLRMIWKS